MICRRLKEYGQRISLVASLFGAHLVEDPNDLFLKVSQILRGLGISVPTLKLPTPSQHGEDLYEQGQLSLSAAEFEQSGLRGRARARKVRRQISELSMPILGSLPLDRDSDPHNILFYLTNSKPFTQSGYTERSHFILKALNEHGMNIRAVTRLGYPFVIGDFPRRKKFTLNGVEYRQMLPSLFPRSKKQQVELAVKMLVDQARIFDAHILHTTTDYKNAIIVSRAAQILGIPWVYETRGELHKTWLSKRRPDIQAIARDSEFFVGAQNKELEAMEKAAAVIQLSEVSKRNAVISGISAEKIHVIPNAVAEAEIGHSFIKTDLRDELGLLADKTLVGAITSIVQYEGLDDLIRAIELLPDVHCVIVGEGETKPSLEKLVYELELGERVHFVGKQPVGTIWKWYAVLDVFAIPRKNQEVCRTVTPIKTLMAQAYDVPVISSDLPALREVTGNLAVYFPAENPEEIARAVSLAINNSPETTSAQTSLARKWVRTRTWRVNAQKLASIYADQGAQNL